MRPRRLFRRVLASQSGASEAVEFALVLPFLLGMLFGVIEFGQALWTQGALDFAVQAAARCASINTSTCSSSTTITSYASTETSPLNIPSSDFTYTSTTCGNQVTASYTFDFLSTFNLFAGKAWFPTSITLTASACYPT